MAPQHLAPTTVSPCSQGGMGANRPATISTMTMSKKGEEGGEDMMMPMPTQDRMMTGMRGRQ